MTLYDSECWTATKIDTLDQRRLQKLLRIKRYHHVRNNEVKR